MSHLISMELKRFSLKPHLIGLFAANIIILSLSVFTSILLMSLEDSFMGTMLPAFKLSTMTLATMLVRTMLIVWEAVLIAVFIIEEYRSKTVSLLFTYPVDKAKLIWSKILLICLIMLAFHICSYVFLHICISFMSRQFEFVTYSFDGLLVQAVITVSTIMLGLVPLCIGMMKRSTIATIVSSLIIAAVVSNSQGNFAGLLSVPILAAFFGAIGTAVSVFTIKKMVSSDLYN